MDNSQTRFETWADSFHFTEDLKELEAMYLEQHYEDLQKQANMPDHSPRYQPKETAPQNEDAAFLDSLSQQIASRLGTTLSSPDVLERYFKMKDLERDSSVMAHQIQELLDERFQLENEIDRLRKENGQYQRIFGKFYIKK